MVTTTGADVVEPPATSVATAVSERVPVLVGRQVTWYGDVVSVPICELPSRTTTRATPDAALPPVPLSVAVARTVIEVLRRYDPAAGLVNATVGGAASILISCDFGVSAVPAVVK